MKKQTCTVRNIKLVVHSSTYTKYTLHSPAPILPQDAVVRVESLDQLLRRQHGEGILQQDKEDKR